MRRNMMLIPSIQHLSVSFSDDPSQFPQGVKMITKATLLDYKWKLPAKYRAADLIWAATKKYIYLCTALIEF